MKKHTALFLSLTLSAVVVFCPTGARADAAAHAIWGIGVQLGWTEVGAYQGVSPATLAQSLAYARNLASQTGCISPNELESLRLEMSQTVDSRTMYQRVSAYRQSLPSYLQRCSCAGGGNAAWALWGLGVQIGYAEMASYLGIAPGTVAQALTSARDHARQISCINTGPIEEMIAAISRAGDSRALYPRITSYRQGQLLAEVQQNCNCAGKSQPNLGGGQSQLSLEQGTNRYGMDYRGVVLPNPDPELCRAECARDPNCRAYSYVRPGIQGPQARCWLKNGVPSPSSSDCCVSGVKAQPSPGQSGGGGPSGGGAGNSPGSRQPDLADAGETIIEIGETNLTPPPLPLPPVGSINAAGKLVAAAHSETPSSFETAKLLQASFVKPEAAQLRPAIRGVRPLYKPIEGCYHDRLQVEVDLTGIGDDRNKLFDYYMDVYIGGYIAESRKEGCIKDAYVMQRIRLSAWSNPYKTYEFDLPDVLPAKIRVEIYERVAGQGKLLDTRETEFNLDIGDLEFRVKVWGDQSKNILTAYSMQVLTSGNIRTKKENSAASEPTMIWLRIPHKQILDVSSIAEAFRSVPDFKGKKSITRLKGDLDWNIARSSLDTCIYDRDKRNNIKYPFRPNNGYIGGRPVPKTITINSTENGPPVRCSN